jgi:hypothetical protein
MCATSAREETKKKFKVPIVVVLWRIRIPPSSSTSSFVCRFG